MYNTTPTWVYNTTERRLHTHQEQNPDTQETEEEQSKDHLHKNQMSGAYAHEHIAKPGGRTTPAGNKKFRRIRRRSQNNQTRNNHPPT